MPDTRAIALPAALLLATAALACSLAAACAFLLVALVLVSGHGAISLHDGAWAVWCGAAAGACGTVAALLALTRATGGLRPLALAAAWALAFAWPLTGVAPVAIAATLATGFVVRWGASDPRAARHAVPVAGALAAAAFVLLGAAFGGAPAGSAGEARAGTGAADVPAPGARDDARRTQPDEQAARLGERSAPLSERGAATVERPPSALAGAPPARVVRAYYRALDERDFSRAWQVLSPAVRAGFGGFDRWRAGFGATLSSRPGALRTTAAGDEATVELVLTARDAAACGVVEQRFSVRWRLRRTPARWRADELSARASGAPSCV